MAAEPWLFNGRDLGFGQDYPCPSIELFWGSRGAWYDTWRAGVLTMVCGDRHGIPGGEADDSAYLARDREFVVSDNSEMNGNTENDKPDEPPPASGRGAQPEPI